MKALALAALLVLIPSTAIAERQQPVEQESPNFFDNNCAIDANPACDPSLWVVNPTPCIWDVDDHEAHWTTSATLKGEISDTLCVIADPFDSFAGDGKLWAARVIAKSPGVAVSVSSSLGDTWKASQPVKSNGQYAYTVCGGEGPFQYAGPWDLIPESNGGTGKRIDFTLHVAAAKKLTGSTVIFETYGLPIQADFGGLC